MMVGRGLNWEGAVKAALNPEKTYPPPPTSPQTKHTHAKIKTPQLTVIKLFKVQYSNEYDPNTMIKNTWEESNNALM